MRDTERREDGSIERWGATAFLVAGALFLANGAVVGMEAASDVSRPSWMFALVVVPGMVAGHVGLFGLFGRLADRTPKLARVAGAVVAIALVAAVGNAVVHLVDNYAVGVETGLGPLFYLVMVLGTIGGFLLFGVASLRSDGHSRVVSVLLFGPPVVFAVMLGTGLAGYTQAWMTVAVGAAQAGAHLAVGYALRNGRASARPGTSATDAAS